MATATKREKKLSVSTMNPVNEEDESTMTTNNLNFDNDASESSFDIGNEQNKLRKNIETVFKSLPPCNELVDLDKDNKRLSALEQLLIDRLVYEQPIATSRPERTTEAARPQSSAQYSSNFTANYLSKNQPLITPRVAAALSAEFNPNILDLNDLKLTNELIKNFSKDRLVETILTSARSENELDTPRSENMTASQLNLRKNAKEILEINFSRNKLHLLPMKILELFRKLQKLDLSENNFEYIELYDLNQKGKLKDINLSSNLLKSFEKPTQTESEDEERRRLVVTHSDILKHLERLNLSNNRLSSLACMCLTQLENLKSLDLSNNEFQLNPLANDFCQMPWQSTKSLLNNLTELNLSKNNKPSTNETDEVPGNVITERAVSVSSVMSNYSSAVPPQRSNSRLIRNTFFFNRLINLKILNISENNLHNMPGDIKELKHLEELYLDNNFLEFLPNELTGLKNLRILSASGNLITELNTSFCANARFKSNIERLNLSRNKLKNSTFTYKVALFQKLMYFDLSENLFELVPNPLPKNIIELNLNKNKIKSLMIIPMSSQERSDEEILAALGMRDKKITKEVSSSFGHGFDDVALKKSFILDDTIYDEPDIDKKDELQLPHVFFLRQMKRLYLTDNLITEVPADFGILNSRLEFIDMSRNLLTQLDLSLCRGLVGLKHLDLTANQIASLPNKIRELSDLEYLNLSHNLLSSLNYEVCNSLKNLKELHLNNNLLEILVPAPPQRRSLGRQFFGADSSLSMSTTSMSGQVKFTFNLPVLTKLNLSGNQFAGVFEIYKSFGLLSKVSEIDLSGNLISYFDAETHEDNLIDLSFNQKIGLEELGEKTKSLSQPKHHLYDLKTVNLSHNQVAFNRGGFMRMINNISKIAPNLHSFLYDQKNGIKINLQDPDVDENFYFEFEDLTEDIEPQLIKSLKCVDLSNNNLHKIPNLLYNLENLREIYFNGNFLKKIPNEMYQHPLDNNAKEFNELKRIQTAAEKKRLKELKKREEGEEETDDEEKKPPKRKKKPKVDPLILQSQIFEDEPEQKKLLSEHIELLHLNNNLIEHIPENLFVCFKALVELKLDYNPLKDPPQYSVCVSSKLTRANLTQLNSGKKLSEDKGTSTLPDGQNLLKKRKAPILQSPKYCFGSLQKETNEISDLNLPNLFFENSNLKPLQSYMVHHKKREDMLLCSMFMAIKDNIESKETLLKILRRLKMPMDKVDYVCKEIQNNVSKNWRKIAEIEFPIIPGKLSLSRKEMLIQMQKYILKLQAWNLLNAWRNTFGADAPSDELVRILKLMNSTDNENLLYEKIFKLKYSACNMFRV